MTGLRPLADDGTVPDVFVDGQPYQITAALTFFKLKHLAAWERLTADGVKRIELHPWDSWDRMGDRLGSRLGQHIWHPSHWDAYYASLPDVPASTPGAIPLTMAVVRREQRRAASANQLSLLGETA